MKIITIFLCVLSVGCVTSHHQKSSALKSSSRKNPEGVTEKNSQPRTASQQDKRDRELLLKRKAEIEMAKRQKSSRDLLSSGPKEDDLNSMTESQLFAGLLARFQRNDELGFKQYLKIFMEKYPQSSRADEVLYMAGMGSVGVKNYGLALKYFNEVIQKYPFGAKASMALFAKAAVLKKMDFVPVSKGIFKQVIARYPGSPEAERAKIELRLIR
jgi:TolA-binding protein